MMKMKCQLRNERGIALVTTLMLLVLGFAVVVTLLRLVTTETKLTRLEQSYTTALDASKAGTDLFIFLVQNGLSAPPNPGVGTNPFGSSANSHCLHVKMNNPTASWYGQAEWTGNACPSLASGLATNPDPTDQPDIKLTLSNYNVSLRVVDTTLTAASTVTPAPPILPPCYNGCSFYTVTVRAQAPATGEHADITFLYRYDN